jgi:hypothetical protein
VLTLEGGDAALGTGAPLDELDEVVSGFDASPSCSGLALAQMATVLTPRASRLPEPSPPTDREPRPASDVPVTQGPGAGHLSTVECLDEVPGIAERAAQVIIAEVGLDMAQFPTPAHLVSWAKLSPQTIQSWPRTRAGKTGKGNRYLKGVLGEVATAAAKTDTFLGERYRRLVRRRGKQRALVAVARSILVIVWHLLNDPDATSTSAPTTTPHDSTPTARPATSSANSKPSDTRSHSLPPPDHHTVGATPRAGLRPAARPGAHDLSRHQEIFRSALPAQVGPDQVSFCARWRGRDASVKMVAGEPVTPSCSWS